MISLILNVALAGGLAFLAQQKPVTSEAISTRVVGPDRVIVATEEQSSGAHFGPVYEALLPGNASGHPELFDLEKGSRLKEPAFDTFNNDPSAALSWILSTGMDVSGIVCPEAEPCCVTYYMAVVHCPKEAWGTKSAADVLASPELANIKNPKRTCLIVRDEKCYLFRTHTGNSGMMMLEDSGDSIRIRYKLANPLSAPTELARAASNQLP
jgi:hypothetical protein